MNKIDRLEEKINTCRTNLETEKDKSERNDILIEILTNRIRIFEDRRKKHLEIQKNEKEVFESQQKRKRGRKRIK
jgi:hypothetical protein